MANRPKGYGLTAETKSKIAAKYDIEKEQEARVWMEAVVAEPMDPEADPNSPLGPDKLYECLRDGSYLIKLMNQLTAPASKIKVNTMKVPFKLMENISNFLIAAEKYGVAKTDLFQTVDLYENQNLWQVVCCIHALGRKAQGNGYTGPVLGPKEADKNAREFSDEQIAAGKSVIGLQMGTNKCASQAGMSMGGQRHINDIKCDDMTREGGAVIGLQMGSNKGASQAGQSFGKARHIVD